jgi:hypothetical protein
MVVRPATNSSINASASLGPIAFRSSVGFMTPVICPFISTASDFRMSNSKPKAIASPAFTTNGLLRLNLTVEVDSVAGGVVVDVRLLIVGRVGGVVCGFVTLR